MDDAEAKRAFERLSKKLENRFRFAVQHRDGLCSTTWAIWEHGDTVYLANRNVGGMLKVSLHPVGGYRMAIPKQHYERLSAEGKAPESRTIVKWDRPDPPIQGAKMVLSIEFPSAHFRSTEPVGSPSKPLVIFGTQIDGAAAQVGFFVSREPAATLEPKLRSVGMPLFGWSLADGSSINVVAREIAFDATALPPRGVPIPGPIARLNNLKARDNLTALFWNEPVGDAPMYLIEAGGVSITGSAEPAKTDGGSG